MFEAILRFSSQVAAARERLGFVSRPFLRGWSWSGSVKSLRIRKFGFSLADARGRGRTSSSTAPATAPGLQSASLVSPALYDCANNTPNLLESVRVAVRRIPLTGVLHTSHAPMPNSRYPPARLLQEQCAAPCPPTAHGPRRRPRGSSLPSGRRRSHSTTAAASSPGR